MTEQWGDLNLLGRLKLVSKWHFRGVSGRKMAQMFGTDEKEVRKCIAQITSRVREFEDIDAHLKNLIARTGEELTKLGELEADLWQQLDHAKEMTVKVDGFGVPIRKLDLVSGQPVKENGNDVFEIVPRKASIIPTLVGQLANLSKQKAELLKLIGPKVDISVNLQLQLQMQSRLMEVIRESSPELYGRVYRELQVLADNAKQTLALPSGTDVIDAEYEEVG